MNDATEPEAGKPSVLVVEDDRGVRESLAVVMQVQQYAVTGVESGEAAVAHLTSTHADLVILDLNLPGIDGLETCRQIRNGGFSGPVLMLTARHEVVDRVRGLDAGADDYLPKPFALDELLARIRALLRAFDVAAVRSDTHLLRLGDLTLDRNTRRVTRGESEVELTKIEFELLAYLLDNADRVMDRNDIHLAVWGYDEDTSSNTLEVFVSSLRKKIEATGGQRLIHTKRGVGYVARVIS
ncbi:MAG: two-component system response regulator MprA [Verrucomicrobiales bacterium]|jgi:two-component system response regulator MprA